MEDLNIKKELEQLNPLLKKLRAQEASEMPSGYFNNLRQNILAQTTENKPVKQKKTLRFGLLKIAASVAILIGIGMGSYTLLNQQKQQTANITLDDLSTAEILDYIDENITDFYDEDLELLISTEDL